MGSSGELIRRRKRRGVLAVVAGLVVAGGVLVGAAPSASDRANVVYVIARSGSMGAPAGACGTRLVCVKAAVTAVNSSLHGRSEVAWTGLGTANPSGSVRDVDFGAAGVQLLVEPQHDGNKNGRVDIADAVQRVSAGGTSCFACGLQAADAILEQASEPGERNVVVFIADRPSLTGADVASLAGLFDAGTHIRAIAVGPRATCGEQRLKVGRGGRSEVWAASLAPVAALTAGGTCVHTGDFDGLAGVIEAAIG